jgi:hypothetical protein
MSIDEGSNNFDCHDVDDKKQLLNYLERQLQGNLDATANKIIPVIFSLASCGAFLCLLNLLVLLSGKIKKFL